LVLYSQIADFIKNNRLHAETDSNVGFHLMEFGCWMVRWALSALIDHWGSQLAALRDSALRCDLADLRDSASSLQTDQKALLALRRDCGPFLKDLAEASTARELGRGKEYEFTRVNGQDDKRNLLDTLMEYWSKHVPRLQRSLQDVGDSISTASALVAASAQMKLAKTNVRLQWGVVILTVLIIVLMFVLKGD
jgi:hypothetical protein